MSTPSLPTAADWRSWGIDPTWSRTVDAAGHRWHLLERRPAEPLATIVCVHGNPTWSYLWQPLLEHLGGRCRVIALDQLGMGYSDRMGPREYAQRVIDLGDVIDVLDIDGPIVMIGHDWGGAVAMGWAVDHPDRLAGLVLCNTGIAVPEGRRAPSLIRLAAAGPMTDLACRRTNTFVAGTIALSYRRLPARARAALRAPYRRAAHRAAIADFVADVPFDTTHRSSAAIARVAEALGTVQAPTLLVWGANDPVFDDSFALDLARRLPHADQHRFADAGHLAPLEADVAHVVDSWLDSCLDSPLDARRSPATSEPSTHDTSTRTTTHDTTATAYHPTWHAIDERADDPTTAFVDGATGARTSFHELHRQVTGIARGLGEHGLRPGDRVAMLIPPSIDLVAAVYGVWRAGGVTVIADRGLGLRGLGAAMRSAHVDWLIGPPAAIAAARAMRWAPRARIVAVGDRRVLGAEVTLGTLASSAAVLPDEPGQDDPAAVLFTSGATGPAKGVRYRHRQLAAQRDALASTYGITSDDRLVAAFAPFALYGPALGITSTIPDVDVTKPGTLSAAALAEACASVDATIVFASPAALANVVRTSVAPDRSGAGVRLVLSAGAPVPVATLRAVSPLFPSAELHTPYGMTECLPVADVSLAGIDAAYTDDSRRGVCVGPPVAGAEVIIAPLGFDAGEPVDTLATGTTGEVLVAAAWCSDGYDRRWGTEHQARPTDATGRTWHRSGDVGHLDATGRLWIEGRSVHIIHTDRGPVTPVPVEVLVEALPAVERAAAVGVGPVGCQQVVIVVEQQGDPGLASPSLAAGVRGALDHPVAAVLTAPSLPVDIRHNTKIDRTLLATWADRMLGGGPTRIIW